MTLHTLHAVEALAAGASDKVHRVVQVGVDRHEPVCTQQHSSQLFMCNLRISWALWQGTMSGKRSRGKYSYSRAQAPNARLFDVSEQGH